MPDQKDQTGHKVAIYSKYVESAVKVLDQRIAMNNAYWAANLAATAAILWAMRTEPVLYAGISLALVFMICLNALWVLALKNLRSLSTAKFDVVSAMEKDLPSQPFTEEWRRLEERGYRPLTHIDRLQVFAAMAFYALLLAYLWLRYLKIVTV